MLLNSLGWMFFESLFFGTTKKYNKVEWNIKLLDDNRLQEFLHQSFVILCKYDIKHDLCHFHCKNYVTNTSSNFAVGIFIKTDFDIGSVLSN